MFMRYASCPRFHRTGFLVAFIASAFLFGCATPDPYDKVALGDSRAHVAELLGAPSVPERDFTHNELKAVQGSLDAMKQGAESYSVWKRQGELFYVVGFDKNGAVAVKRLFFYVAP